jgi:hypothetical protein
MAHHHEEPCLFHRYRYRFLNEKVKDENCGATDGIVIHGENNMSPLSYVSTER